MSEENKNQTVDSKIEFSLIFALAEQSGVKPKELAEMLEKQTSGESDYMKEFTLEFAKITIEAMSKKKNKK